MVLHPSSTVSGSHKKLFTGVARAQRSKGQNVTLEVTTSNSTNKDSLKSSKVVTDDWDERPFPDTTLLDIIKLLIIFDIIKNDQCLYFSKKN